MTRPDEVVVAQPAVNLETCAAEIDGILAEIRKGEAVLDAATRFVDDWRTKAGVVFLQVRKTIPERGPNAKKWGDFVEARGITTQTALNYMKLAEHAAANPGAPAVPVIDIYRELGIKAPAAAPSPPAAPVAIKNWDTQYTIGTPAPRVFPALPPVQPGILSWAELPEWADPAVYTRATEPPPDAASYFPRLLRQELTREQVFWRNRLMAGADAMDAELERIRPFREAYKAARAERKQPQAEAPAPNAPAAAAAAPARAKPAPEPLPQAQDPVAAAVQVIEAAEAMGKDDAARKAPRLIGEVVNKLRQQGHLIPAGEDRTVYGAYERGRSWRAPALPLGPVVQPKPSLYTTPLFPDGPGPALAQPRGAAPAAREEDEDDFDADDDRDMARADEEDRADEDELREAVDEVEGELAQAKKEMEGLRADLVQARRERDGAREEMALLCKERDQAQRDCELAAKAHAQALKTMEGMERELAELRDGWELAARERVAGADLRVRLDKAEDERAALVDQVRRLREDAGAAGLVLCEHDDGEGGCDRICAPNPEGEALCPAHQAALAEAAATPLLKPKASRGKAKASRGKAKAPPAPWHQDPARVNAALLEVLRYLQDRGFLKIAEGEGLSNPDLCGRLADAIGARLYMDGNTDRPRAELLSGLSRRVGGHYFADGLRINFGDDTDEGLGEKQTVLTLEGQPLVDAVRRVLKIPLADLSEDLRFLTLDFEAPAPKISWQPASIGGAKAVHALADRAVSAAAAEGGHPAALCSQRPSYKSKGWTPRPGVALTCDDCRREAGHR